MFVAGQFMGLAGLVMLVVGVVSNATAIRGRHRAVGRQGISFLWHTLMTAGLVLVITGLLVVTIWLPD